MMCAESFEWWICCLGTPGSATIFGGKKIQFQIHISNVKRKTILANQKGDILSWMKQSYCTFFQVLNPSELFADIVVERE